MPASKILARNAISSQATPEGIYDPACFQSSLARQTFVLPRGLAAITPGHSHRHALPKVTTPLPKTELVTASGLSFLHDQARNWNTMK
jgi:hypothetical protein